MSLTIVATSREIRRRINKVARRQRNLITRLQLLQCGFPDSSISNWVADGRLVRVHRGVYFLGSGYLDLTTRRLAAVLACPDGSALDHLAGLDHWDFSRFTSSDVTVGLAQRKSGVLDGCRTFASQAYAEGHVQCRKGVPTASVSWIISGLGDTFTAEQIANVIYQAHLRRLVTVDEIEVILESRTRVKGRHVVIAAIHMYRLGSAGTRSSFEDTVLAWVKKLAHRTPLVNIHVTAGDQDFEIDIPFKELMLCIEVDGPLHDQPAQQELDRIRDKALRAAGYRVERFHWRDIKYRPEACKQRLREILGAYRAGLC